MPTIHRYHDRAFLTLYMHNGDTFDLSASADPSAAASPLIAASFGKNMPQVGQAQHAGDASFALRWTPDLQRRYPGREWTEIVQGGAWWLLEAESGGQRHVVSLGILDDPENTADVRGGVEVPSCTYPARDWAKVIDDTLIWFCELAKDSANYLGVRMLDLLSYEVQGPPDTIVSKLLQGFLSPSTGDGGTWELPAALASRLGLAPVIDGAGVARPPSARHLIDTENFVASTRGCGVVNDFALSSYSLASLLEEWGNTLLNELFFDLRPLIPGVSVPAMVMRERPFPVYREYQTSGYSAWADLPRIVLPRDRVMGGMALRRMGSERVTAINFQQQNDPITPFESMLVSPPVINAAMTRKYGLHLYDPTTRFLALPNTAGLLAPEEAGRWKWLLASWNACNHGLLSGSLTIRGFDPGLRIGRVITIGSGQYPDADPNRFTAYIEGVQLAWSPPPGGWTTTLRVTRGLRGDYLAGVARLQKEWWDGAESIGGPAGVAPSVNAAFNLTLLPTGPLRVPPDRLACYAAGKSAVRAGILYPGGAAFGPGV